MLFSHCLGSPLGKPEPVSVSIPCNRQFFSLGRNIEKRAVQAVKPLQPFT